MQKQNAENNTSKFAKRIYRLISFQYQHKKRILKYFILRLTTRNGMLMRDVQGSKMRLSLHDRGISSDLAIDGIREPVSTKILQQEIAQGSTIMDIGANIGYYTLMMSRLAGKNGVVYSLEPSPSNFHSLNKNIKLNGYRNIRTYQIGIGDRKGKETMQISHKSNLDSFVLQKNRKAIGSMEINISALDDFIRNKRKPDFIKMDVEGYEYNAIKGMKAILKSKKPLKIFMEIHPHIMKKEQTLFVLGTLKNAGFETSHVTRCFTVAEMCVKNMKDYDYSSMSIKDIMQDEFIVTGTKGAFEIFFERK